MEASVFTMAKQTEMFARLRDFIITNVDPNTVHKKVNMRCEVVKLGAMCASQEGSRKLIGTDFQTWSCLMPASFRNCAGKWNEGPKSQKGMHFEAVWNTSFVGW